MKSRISLVLLTFVLAASSTLMAHAKGCTNMTLKGVWVNSLRGQIFLPDGTSLVLTGVTKSTYDGLGNSTATRCVWRERKRSSGLAHRVGHLYREPGLHGDRDDLVS